MLHTLIFQDEFVIFIGIARIIIHLLQIFLVIIGKPEMYTLLINI